MKKTGSILIAGMALAQFSANAQLTINQTTGTPFQTPALTAFTTTGDQMAGMSVAVVFTDNSVKTATWATTGAGAGAASVASFFTISESGDTFNDNAWTLHNNSSILGIKSFSMFAAPGDTTFDRTFGGVEGTPGSANGKDFAIAGITSPLTATYSDILNLTGSAAVGDEFELLTVQFGTDHPFAAGASTTFSQDTDSTATAGTITPTPDATSTMALLGFGLAGLAALKRRIS